MDRRSWSALAACAALAFVATPAYAASDRPTTGCERGTALERVARYDRAADAFLRGLERTATLACSQAGLARVADAIRRECEDARELRSAGERGAANSAYLTLLERAPSNRCARAGVAATAPRSVWSDVDSVVEDAWNLLVGATIVVLLVLTALGLSSLVIYVASLMPRVRETRVIRRLRRPVIAIESLDDAAHRGLGPGTTAIVRGAYATGSGLDHGAYLVYNEAAAMNALGGLGTVAPQAATAAALLTLVRFLLPRPEWRVRGELLPAGERGYGLALALHAGARHNASVELWSSPPEEAPVAQQPPDTDPAPDRAAAEAFATLAVSGAGWLEHQVSQKTRPRRLLTREPLSSACLSVGLHWDSRGHDTRAESYYRTALEIDPDNIGALTNLGIALEADDERTEKGAENVALAKRHMSRALGLIEKPESELPCHLNTHWFRVKYALAAWYANRASARDCPPKTRSEAQQHARELVEHTVLAREDLAARERRNPADRTRRRCRRSLTDRECEELQRFIDEDLQPSALLLYAMHFDRGEAPYGPVSQEAMERELALEKPNPLVLSTYVDGLERRKPRVESDLACLYAIWGMWKESVRSLTASLTHTHGELKPLRGRRALTDPALAGLWDSGEPSAEKLKNELGKLPADDARNLAPTPVIAALVAALRRQASRARSA